MPAGSNRRGSRTIAKEKLYKHINAHIRSLHKGFNIGITTGTRGDMENLWRDPYRHWRFEPKDAQRDSSKTKGKKKKAG